ncbi:MAG: SDR family oxidoreductase, partial [Bacteroidota bacterium]
MPKKYFSFFSFGKLLFFRRLENARSIDEWGEVGIRSNAICPGLIRTKFSAALWQDEKTKTQFTQHIPSGRIAQPDEMARLALFLSSDAASYCTGGI